MVSRMPKRASLVPIRPRVGTDYHAALDHHALAAVIALALDLLDLDQHPSHSARVGGELHTVLGLAPRTRARPRKHRPPRVNLLRYHPAYSTRDVGRLSVCVR